MNRREFLRGASLLALLRDTPALAGLHLHGSSGFNGGKAQLQSQFLLASGDYPFINMMKTMQAWTYINTGFPPVPSDLDVNGYPTIINNGGLSNIFFPPPTAAKPGTYVLTWDGRGTVFVTGASITSGSFSNLGGAASGRCEFTFSSVVIGQTQTIGITALTSSLDHPHNMQLFYKTEEAALNAGQIISTDFLNLMRSGNPGVMRFLNWQGANSSNITTLETEKPEGHYSYVAQEYRASLFAGTTTGTGDNYIINLGVAAPVDKQTVIVIFDKTAATQGDCTFSIDNGATAHSMVDYTFLSFFVPTGGLTATLVYDAELGVWMKWGGYPQNSTGLNGGVPPSVLVKICQKIGCHPYFVVPPMASNPLTNWVTGLDAYIQANAPSWMIPRYEGPNENWNGQFFVNSYGLNKAQLYWGTQNNGANFWCGYMMSLLAQAVASGRATPKVGYQVLCGVQSSSYTQTSTSNPRLNNVRNKGFTTATPTASTNNITLGANPYVPGNTVSIIGISSADNAFSGFSLDTTYFVKTSVGNVITLSATNGGAAINVGTAVNATVFNLVPATSLPAYNWVTTVCITNYVNSNFQDTVAEIGQAYSLATGTTSVVATFEADNTVTDGRLLTSYKNWYNWANSFGPAIKLCGYEGGWSPDYLVPAFSVSAVISGATKANPCVLTLAQTTYKSTIAGNACAVGMPLCPQSIVGMTQLNKTAKNITVTGGTPGVFNWGSAHGFLAGQPITFASDVFTTAPALPTNISAFIAYFVSDPAPGADNTKFTVSATNGGPALATSSSGKISASPCFVVSAINVGGDPTKIAINVDSTAFSTYTSGGSAFYGCPDPGGGSAGSSNAINSLRFASKFASQLQADTLLNYQQFNNVGNLWGQAGSGEFPSVFQVAGTSNVWSEWDPDIYLSPTPPAWLAFIQFNH